MPATAAGHPSAAALAAYALGKLDGPDAETVHDHLAACSDCRTVVETTPRDTLLGLLRKSDTVGTRQVPNSALDESDLPPELRDHPRYRIVRKLGQGGMGAVYQAEHKLMERVVAVKVIAAGLVDSPDAVERFQREVRAAAKLDHPNIVRAFDADTAGGAMLLAMEFVPGRSLADVVHSKGPLPVAYACQCVRQAAQGLQHAAEQGMVHRDIKPQNLMLSDKGVVKVLDFGLAKVVSERLSQPGLTGQNMVMGTPEYMAPEQVRNTSAADIRADIYSLGCTLFYLLTGRPPFRGESAIDVVSKQVTDAPPRVTELRPDVPAELADLVDQMLAKDPAARPQTPRDVAKALAALTRAGGRSPTTVAEPVAPPPLPRRGGRRPWVAVASVLLLGAVGAAILLTLRTKVGVVTLEVDPPDAKVEVTDGRITVSRPGDDDPWRIELAGETGRLTISKAGFEVKTQQVTLNQKGTTIAVKLEPAGDHAKVGPPAQATEPELFMTWHREFYGDGKWQALDDLLLYSNGNVKRPENSLHTWSLKGNVLTVSWTHGRLFDRVFLSDDGLHYAGLGSAVTPLRGDLRWKKANGTSDDSGGTPKAIATVSPKPLFSPDPDKRELIAVWRHEVFENTNWTPRPDVLQYSNGKLNGADSIHTWSMNGLSLVFVWSHGSPIDRLIVSDDGLNYVGANQGGSPIRGFLRWKKVPESTEASPGKDTADLVMIWGLSVNERGKWTPRPDLLQYSNGKAGVSENWTMVGNVLTVKTTNGATLLRAKVSDDKRTFEGKNQSGQIVRGKLRWKKE
jgi:Protein kinase domain/Putative zinc-finger